MDITVRESLIAGGIDVDDVLKRCMGSEALVERLLKKFLIDSSYEKLVEAIRNKDENAVMDAAHTLKGVCGNLSINHLFVLVDCMVQKLRRYEYDAAVAMMSDITDKYNSAVSAIHNAFD